MSICRQKNDGISLPIDERPLYANPLLALSRVLTRDRGRLLAFVPPDH